MLDEIQRLHDDGARQRCSRSRMASGRASMMSPDAALEALPGALGRAGILLDYQCQGAA